MQYSRKAAATKRWEKGFNFSTEELGPREVRVRCSSAGIDRDGEIVVQEGVILPESVPVQWGHDSKQPALGRAKVGLSGGTLYADVVFDPEGVDPLTDSVCAKVKAGTIDSVSIGFMPLEEEPMDPSRPRGAKRIKRCELLEVSFVNVPANPDAVVVQRAFGVGGAGGAKGLAEVARLAYLLDDLSWLEDCVEWEAQWEQDNSPLPAKLGAVMQQLGAVLVEMAAEEVAELIGDEAGEAEMKSFQSRVKEKFLTRVKLGKKVSSETRGHLENACANIKSALDSVNTVLDAGGQQDSGASADDDADEVVLKAAKAARRKMVNALRVGRV